MAAADPRGAARRRPSAVRLLAGQVRYQLRMLVRSPLGSFATLVIPLMVLLAVSLLFEETRLAARGDIRYVQFFAPAMAAFAVVNACYMSVISTTTLARDEGVLKRIRSTPLPAWVYMAGRIATAGVVSAVSVVIVLGLAATVYGFQIIWSALPTVTVEVAVAIFTFCSLGLAVTVLVPRADSALPIAWGTALPLCFVSDVFQPIDSAPAWLGTAASVFPLRPFADDLEAALDPVTRTQAVNWGHLAVMAAWGVAAAAFALARFRWEPGGVDRRPRLRRHLGGGALPVVGVRDVLEHRGRPWRPVASRERPGEAESARRRLAPEGETVLPALPLPGAVAGTGAELIEGPAPAEDSSIPAGPAEAAGA